LLLSVAGGDDKGRRRIGYGLATGRVVEAANDEQAWNEAARVPMKRLDFRERLNQSLVFGNDDARKT